MCGSEARLEVKRGRFGPVCGNWECSGMENSYKYFENRECRYFPCHSGADPDTAGFNCLFCYCPLYHMENCPGNKSYKETDGRKIKVCTGCSFPHRPESYELIMRMLKGMN